MLLHVKHRIFVAAACPPVRHTRGLALLCSSGSQTVKPLNFLFVLGKTRSPAPWAARPGSCPGRLTAGCLAWVCCWVEFKELRSHWLPCSCSFQPIGPLPAPCRGEGRGLARPAGRGRWRRRRAPPWVRWANCRALLRGRAPLVS